tara:strand:- start:62 stop:220 length:159 start_codon:yes stop_codon:yes gene_type:complete
VLIGPTGPGEIPFAECITLSIPLILGISLGTISSKIIPVVLLNALKGNTLYI